MKRSTIAALIVTILLGACSSDGDSTASPSTEVASTSDSRVDGSTEPATTEKPPADEGSESGGSGESASEDRLTAEGLLDGGVVSLGPVGPEDPAVDHAICDYVFGTPEEVASIAQVDGQVALTEESGYQQMGGGGSGPRCTYTVDGQEAFGLWLWNDELEVEDLDRIVAQVEVGRDEFGLVARHPEWDGEMGVDSKTGAQWLQDAGTRWGGASV